MRRPWQAPRPPLVLASGSRVRARLLAEAGIGAERIVSGVDEAALKRRAADEGLSAGQTALLLAEAKSAVVAMHRPQHLVLGADQILSLDGIWLDKPGSPEEAKQQLLRQRGRSVTLHTAAVLRSGADVVWSHLAEPCVAMRHFSDDLLDAYVAAEGDQLLECVGACRLEGPGLLLIERLEGEFTALLGLPMLALVEALRRHDVLLA